MQAQREDAMYIPLETLTDSSLTSLETTQTEAPTEAATVASPDRYDRLRADLWIPPRDSGMRPGADAHREIPSRGNKC